MMEIPQMKNFLKKNITWKEVKTFYSRWGLKSSVKIS